ncbi:ankyrin repeat domain-containing protein 39-like [Schistocerca piceifrons]|uniref:ankyrin repeat domain-containing protein 39-like n=1 Tax=Schistocerca piceifrons TaxID=274613 RepID=UPI001F5F9917|nr:ankyrin repeat domain-containing protein 39-like [Schistocerca piceifrons]
MSTGASHAHWGQTGREYSSQHSYANGEYSRSSVEKDQLIGGTVTLSDRLVLLALCVLLPWWTVPQLYRLHSPTATGGASTPNSDRQPHSGHSRTPAAAAPPTSAQHTPPPDDAAVSRFRSLSDAERGRRLIEAAMEGEVEEVRALLAAGADVGARDWAGRTALHCAARSGHAAVVRLLLSAASDPNARDQWGQTPLHLAAYNGHTEAAAALLQAGADRG